MGESRCVCRRIRAEYVGCVQEGQELRTGLSECAGVHAVGMAITEASRASELGYGNGGALRAVRQWHWAGRGVMLEGIGSNAFPVHESRAVSVNREIRRAIQHLSCIGSRPSDPGLF